MTVTAGLVCKKEENPPWMRPPRWQVAVYVPPSYSFLHRPCCLRTSSGLFGGRGRLPASLWTPLEKACCVPPSLPYLILSGGRGRTGTTVVFSREATNNSPSSLS